MKRIEGNIGVLDKEIKHVYRVILPQSFLGLSASGLFYGWGSISYSMDHVFYTKTGPIPFSYQHGVFSGVLILFLSVVPTFFLRVFILDAKRMSEFTVQAIGVFSLCFGITMVGVSLQFKSLWGLYIFGAIPSGVGALLIYQRLVFSHQFWFKRIDRINMGSGIFGFFIGLWTVVFFLISIPLLKTYPVHTVLYIYAAAVSVFSMYPLFTIDDKALLAIANSCNFDNDFLVNSNCTSDNENNKIGTDYKSQNPEISIRIDQCAEVELDKFNSHKTECSRIHNGILCNREMKCLGTDDIKDNKENDNDNNNIDDEKNDLEHSRNRPIRVVNSYLPIVRAEPEPELAVAVEKEIDMHADMEFALTYTEIISHRQTWILFCFFASELTPGWGIKLASIQMLNNLFNASLEFSALVTSVYVAVYALGRLFSGLMADLIGVKRTFDVMIGITIVALLILPQTSTDRMPHSSQDSVGCTVFCVLICVVGFMYGGVIALFYAIIMEVFGIKNYRNAFSITLKGIGLSVIVGGISAAYSFSQATKADVSAEDRAKIIADTSSSWFYAMACVIASGWVLLHNVSPINYRQIAETRRQEQQQQ